MVALSRAGDSALAILARKLATADPDERYQLFEAGLDLYPLGIRGRIHFAVLYQDPLLAVPVLPPGFGPGYDSSSSYVQARDLPPGPPMLELTHLPSPIEKPNSAISHSLAPALPDLPALSPQQ